MRLPLPRWIAHRGGGSLAPENTLAGNRLAALGCFVGGLGGHAVGDAGVFGVLRDRCRHLLHRCGRLFDAGRLFRRGLGERLRRGGNLPGGIGEVVGGGAHFADDLGQLGDHVLHRAHEHSDLVLACRVETDAQVAFGDPAGRINCFAQRAGDAARDPPGKDNGDEQGAKGHAQDQDFRRFGIFVGCLSGVVHELGLEVDQGVDASKVLGLGFS